MPAAIFYDFETSATHTASQILNYAFVTVDGKFKEQSRLTGEIKVSRLELPAPGAILANRVDILQHQARAGEGEAIHMSRIREYLAQVAGRSREGVPLIGYNSNRFDLRHFRTSFIRSGLNPLNIRGLVFYDLLSIVRRLSALDERFPVIRNQEDCDKLSLSLQSVATELGVLKGAQTHESLEDVLLSIEVARVLSERFGVNVWRSAPYECGDRELGSILYRFEPEYDLKAPKRFSAHPMMLLTAEGSGRLWVDLERFRETPDESSIRWFTRTKSEFLTDGVLLHSAELEQLSSQAREAFKGLSISNFFKRSTCDIELDIHRIDMNGIEMLNRAIWGGERGNALKSGDALRQADLVEVFKRFRLKEYLRGDAHEARFLEELRRYALYRYGGAMIFTRNGGEEGEEESRERHPTYGEMMAELDALYAKGDAEDRGLLDSLRTFYENSEILDVAAELSDETESRVATGSAGI